MKLRLLTALALGAITCGGDEGTSTANTTKPLQIKGQLTGAASAGEKEPLLLAMGWYPLFAGNVPGTSAAAVLTDATVSYEGNFPLDFSFSLSGPPPAAALFDLSTTGGKGHLAYGVLIAFRDRNGNGALDSFDANGTPIDEIAGVSVPDPSRPPPEHSYFVLYLDGAVAPDDTWAALPLQQGYNLMEVHYNFGIEPVPLGTPVTIAVSNDAALNLYACSAAFRTQLIQRTCGIDPYQGKAVLTNNIFSSDTGSTAQLFAGAANGPVLDASVSLDGAEVPFDPASQTYSYSSRSRLIGNHTLSFAAPGFPVETLTFAMPDPVIVSAPAQNQQFVSGSPVNIAWNSVAGAAYYDIYFLDSSANWLFHVITTSTSVTTPPITFTGRANLTVKALAPLAVGSLGSSYVELVSESTLRLTFTQ
ncbi:MAG TPA: hypothetical protein VGH20_19665 [Myxococcales bacterium]|jgi:hypothetical protein